MSALGPRGWSSFRRLRHVSIGGWGAVLGGGLLAGLLARGPTRPPAERPPHTEAANLTEFGEQLRRRGVHLYVVAGARHGRGPDHQVYLTEDPTATWDALASQVKLVERIHQWRGTVCVESPLTGPIEDVAVDHWGVNGRRIGNFVLFGDERILRRIEDACR
jgi:hypothetical protein